MGNTMDEMVKSGEAATSGSGQPATKPWLFWSGVMQQAVSHAAAWLARDKLPMVPATWRLPSI